MRKTIIAIGVITMLVGVLTLPVLASSGSITLDFQVVRGEPGSLHTLYDGPMPVVGENCLVTASSAGNNTSVHEGNDLVLVTGEGVINFNDVERAPNVTTPGSSDITTGATGVVSLVLGPDGVYSADLILEFECTPIPSTTIPSSTTTTEDFTSSSTTTTPTTTTNPPATTTTVVGESTTTTTSSTTTTSIEGECVDNPDTEGQECLPFTGFDSRLLVPIALILLFGGLLLLSWGYRREEGR